MSEPKRYRKKPVEIDAMRWDGGAEAATPIIDWVLSNGGTARWDGPTPAEADCPTPEYHETHHYCPNCSFNDVRERISIDTLEGTIYASPGDFIIRGVQGEFYPCKPDIFDQTYIVLGAGGEIFPCPPDIFEKTYEVKK